MAVIERRLDATTIERRTGTGFWSRPISAAIPIDRELAVYVALVAIGFVLRFWDLGARMLHHDESLHAVYSWYLFIGKGYQHDPMMHGPFLFELNPLVYFLFGVTDATARYAPAFIGTILIALPYFLRHRIGRIGAMVASALLVISPTILYYSRFIRHDIYQITFMMALVVVVFLFLDSPRAGYLYGAAALVSLLFSDKEDTYFLMAILLSFMLWLSLYRNR